MSASFKLLRGNCHCGAYRFEVHIAELNSEKIVKCACTLCRKKGCLWLVVGDGHGELVVERDEGRLVKYQAGDGNAEHEFCSICGTTVIGYHEEGALKGKTSVNARSLREVNIFDYDPLPPQKDSDPDLALTAASPPSLASCHCGKVTLDVLQPLSELEIKEDNCSICTRNAWIGIYPHSSKITLPGSSLAHTTSYSYGRKFNSFPFCSTCGVCVFQTLLGPPKSVVDGLSAAGQERVRGMLEIRPVNVRCLEGVDWDVWEGVRTKTVRNNEGTEGYERDVLGIREEEQKES